MTTRHQNWPLLLDSYITNVPPFQWGTNDCCMFSAGWVLVCTGHDLAGDLRGTYDNELDAVRLLRDAQGIHSLVDSRLTAFGYTEIPVLFAQRGDVVLGPSGHGESLAAGICVGARAAFITAAGLVYLPLSHCTNAWRIS